MKKTLCLFLIAMTLLIPSFFAIAKEKGAGSQGSAVEKRINAGGNRSINIIFSVAPGAPAATGRLVYESANARIRIIALVLIITVFVIIAFALWHG